MKLLRILLLSLLLAQAACSEAFALRVISLYPGHTDNIAALGREASIVALSQGDDLESLAGLPRLPEAVTPEALLAHAPDIVIMRTLNERINPHLTAVLESAGVEVHVMDPPGWDDFGEYLAELAGVVRANPEPALFKLARIREEALAFTASRGGGAERPRFFLEAAGREIHTCAPDSWAAHLIKLCGGENAAESAIPLRRGSPLASWGVERAVGLLGGLDIYLVQQGTMNSSTREDVLSRPWFAAFNEPGAPKRARVEFVPERYLSRPSLIGLERGVDILLSIFYPDLKTEPD